MLKFTKSLLALATIALGISSAEASVSLTITADDASHVKVYVNEWSSELQEDIPRYFEPEGNVFSVTVDDGYRIRVKGVNPWGIESITDDAGTPVDAYKSAGEWSFSSNYLDGKNLNVVTYNQDLERTKSFTLNIDDPDAVNVYLGVGQYPNTYQPDLNPGETVIKYNPDTEYRINISPKYWDETIYGVTLDGQPYDADSMGWYIFDLSDNCSVDVMVHAPARDVNLSFSYSDGSMGCIDKVLVNDEQVEMSEIITVPDGSRIEVFKNNGFNISYWRIGNGEFMLWSGESNVFTVMGDTELYFMAVPKKAVNFVVNVNNAECMSLFVVNDNGEGSPLDLVTGKNDLQLYDGNTYVFWTAAKGCIIDEVRVSSNGEDAELYTAANIVVEDGMVIDFSAREMARTCTAVVWCDGVKDADMGAYIKNRYYEKICDLKEGYNVIQFDEAENPFDVTASFILSDAKFNIFYLDGVRLEPRYADMPSYSVTFSDLSVGKLFLAHRPVDCKITIEIGENVDVEVIRDIIVPVTDFSAPVECFEGTEFKIIPENPVIVSVDGDEIDPEEDGCYIIEANDSYTITVEKNPTVGITGINGESEDDIVYNLLGVSLGKVENINTLAPGIYIIGGKKILVR